jgi:beta-galactosidase
MRGDTVHDDQDSWSEEPSSPASDFVHINMRRKNITNALALRPQHHIKTTETHTFPAKLPDWSNIDVLHRNTLPPRAYFFIYDNVKDALTRDVSKSKTLLLSGTWKFSLAKSPFDVPEDFHDPKFDSKGWDDINVPGMWQLQGYGKGPQYVQIPASRTRLTFQVHECQFPIPS